MKSQSQLSKDLLNSYILKLNSQKSQTDFIKGQGTLDLFGNKDSDIYFENEADFDSSLEIMGKSDSEYLKDAYRELNEKIGYRIF